MEKPLNKRWTQEEMLAAGLGNPFNQPDLPLDQKQYNPFTRTNSITSSISRKSASFKKSRKKPVLSMIKTRSMVSDESSNIGTP